MSLRFVCSFCAHTLPGELDTGGETLLCRVVEQLVRCPSSQRRGKSLQASGMAQHSRPSGAAGSLCLQSEEGHVSLASGLELHPMQSAVEQLVHSASSLRPEPPARPVPEPHSWSSGAAGSLCLRLQLFQY